MGGKPGRRSAHGRLGRVTRLARAIQVGEAFSSSNRDSADDRLGHREGHDRGHVPGSSPPLDRCDHSDGRLVDRPPESELISRRHRFLQAKPGGRVLE